MGGPLGLLVACCLVAIVLGYPSGAPDRDDICRTMKPGHRAAPQAVPPPFTITASETAYLPGESITVVIKGKRDFTFKGFSIQARRADPKLDQTEPIGRFSVIDGTKEICGSARGSGLTHMSGANGNLTDKDMIVLTWKAPTPAQGHVIFRVSVVSSYNTYWVGEMSNILRDPSAPPLPPTEPPLTDNEIPLEPIRLDDCGKTKGCYRNPPGCAETECDAVVTWKDMKDYIAFELSGSANGWVAVGFSHDKLMGDDSVVECVWQASTYSVQISQSYNLRDDKANRVLDSRMHGLGNMQGYLSDDKIRCRFTRQKKVRDVETIFDLTESYYLLVADGEIDVNGVKERHSLEPYKFPMVSPYMVDFTQNVDISGRARYALVKIHGCLMIIAWMMSASLGVIMARYYKRMWPNDRICANKVWFSVHRLCQLLAMFCTIVGVIIIFIHMGGWHKLPELPAKAHPPLGITVLVLVILNPLLAICRCHPEHKWRPVFNWIHWFIGTVCFVLQSPTLFIGLSMPKAFTPWWATWIMVAFFLFHVIIELLLEIHGCINGPKQKQRDLEFELRKRSDPRGELDGYEPEPVGKRFKSIIIWLYIIVMVILGLVMVITVAAA